MNHFFAVDVETANSSMASICQVGLVEFRNGEEVSAQSWYVDPEDDFDVVNTAIHGITRATVRGAPNFASIHAKLSARVDGAVTVCHTHFDRVAFRQACDAWGRRELTCRWLDSAMVARRAWPQFAKAGYGLANVANYLGIQFKHHDALEDARAAGQVMLRAIEETTLNLEGWFERVKQRIAQKDYDERRQGHEFGPLSGERMVFTGVLSMPRAEVADMASALDARVDAGISKWTTAVVVGPGAGNKLAKAREWIEKGRSIRVMNERDFLVFAGINVDANDELSDKERRDQIRQKLIVQILASGEAAEQPGAAA